MARKSRASARRLPYPEKIRIVIAKPLERSGVSFFPAKHFLRRIAGKIPTEIPTMGHSVGGHSVNDEKDPRKGYIGGSQTVAGVNRNYIDVKIVHNATGAVDEMTPSEIYALIQSKTAVFHEDFKGRAELLQEGARQSNRASVRLVEPMARIYRSDYEKADAVPLTAEGLAHQNLISEVDDFTTIAERTRRGTMALVS